MSKYSIDKSTLDAIADAILAKTGGTALLSPLDMPDWIASISGSSGGSGEDLDAVIAEQEELIDAIRAELAKKVLASEEVSYYDGEYAITPKADEEQILPTQGKMMTENIVIRAIPYSVIANDSGMTAVIGG